MDLLEASNLSPDEEFDHNEHLLHQAAEQVPFSWVGPLRHHTLEVVDWA